MAEAKRIDGRVFAEKLRDVVANQVRTLKDLHGLTPGLAVVLVGNDPASEIYVRNKHKMTTHAGMKSFEHKLPAETTQKELLTLIEGLNSDPDVHGILVQLPLPDHIDEQAVLAAIDPAKDVDGFHPLNVGKLLLGDTDGFVPCTPAGVHELLIRSGVATSGAEVVILGRGNIVGKPMAAILCQKSEHANATVTLCHSRSADIGEHCRRADILIVAMGVPEFVKADMVKPGAVVIDVGVNRIPDPEAKNGSRLVGDVHFAEVQAIAGRITPNPGGVGPMTIAMLLRNTVRAAARANGLNLETPES